MRFIVIILLSIIVLSCDKDDDSENIQDCCLNAVTNPEVTKSDSEVTELNNRV
ncbi:hypothetical protein [Patiriisocius sp. Uisw_017]|uniref:hypothetical protein n=1 Tax=Patiriisocius sp. Uisw_017 TaxID=3230968 RepID=UPI0039E8B997